MDKPIIFNAEMVRAITDGSKTQTRRPCKLKDINGKSFYEYSDDAMAALVRHNPFGKPGDLLWVREAFCSDWGDDIVYKADDPTGRGAREAGYNKEPKYKPSIHMPRWASRLTLKITDVRVDRVQDITLADAKAEGIPEYGSDITGFSDHEYDNRTTIENYKLLWNSIYNNWHDNPWVWVISFEVINQNIDKYLEEE